MNSRITEYKRTFQERLIAWYGEHQRDLPWRRTHDPYAIVVSELMLQQTQVDRVQERFVEWMERFPSTAVLARAHQRTVIAAWQGLGYNRRALYLHNMAKIVEREHGGVFPSTREGLLALPGIGPYTAGAVLSFAFGERAPIVDTNVVRVLGRVFDRFDRVKELKESTVWEMMHQVMPGKKQAYIFNQAIMDFGATVCTARKPACGECPMQSLCASYPDVLNASAKQLRHTKKAKERQYFGQPRRIWRGKILKFLHTQPREGATLAAIGAAIQDDFSDDRLEWLQSVIDVLERESFVVVRGNRVRLR